MHPLIALAAELQTYLYQLEESFVGNRKKMASKGPTELELSILAGYRHPAKSLQSLRKDILTISQLSSSLKKYRAKDDETELKRAINLIIILMNVFEKLTIEFAVYAIMSKDLWNDAATLLYALNVSKTEKLVDKILLKRILELKPSR